MNVLKIFAFGALAGCCLVARAQDAQEFVQGAVKVELAKDRADHSRWVFTDHDRKPGSDVVKWVAQTGKGDVNRVIRVNGHQVPEWKQRKRVESFIHDPAAQAKQRQGGQKDARQAASLLRLMPQAFLWTKASADKDTTTLHFRPNPKFDPPSRQAEVFAAMAGEMVVDNKQHRIEKIKGHLTHDVDFGWGILGSLKKGGWFEVDRQEIAPGIWDITETHVHIHGHMLLFKTISEVEDDKETSFSRESGDVTLKEAAVAVMKK
jgi:hypothetical protein